MRVLICFLAFCWVVCAPCGAAGARLEQGEIEGAKFTWARPARWNHRILLLAHGQRPENTPLVADLSPDHAAYQALLNEGWIVAKTSFRRNGTVIADAVTDLDNLRAEVVRRFGKPERVIVEGESMGGLIAVLLAERLPQEPPLYQGVVAIDAALAMHDPSEVAGLSMQPQIPTVFLCSRTEFEGPRHYSEMKMPGVLPLSRPVLLKVNRDGHVNVNQAERLAALRILNTWLDTGLESMPKPAEGAGYLDVTSIPAPVPSRVFLDPDRRGFTAHVTEVSRVYGNVLLDVQPADFAAVGLGLNRFFQLSVRGKNFRIFFGKDFTSVKRGEWVAFPNADGFFWLARNLANAAEVTQAEVGDLVQIRRYDEAPNGSDIDAPGEK